MAAADAPLDEQVATLERALGCNEATLVIARSGGDLGLPNWYLGGGAVAQTVWNQLSGMCSSRGVRDYDLVYFDPGDLTAEAERAVEERARGYFSQLGVTLDVKNQARVHLWYEKRFGRPAQPYRSTEHAISTWPTTASSVGVRYEGGRFVVCAPFGLSDLFAMVVRPNKVLIDRAVYLGKASRWAGLWPKLSVLPWEST